LKRKAELLDYGGSGERKGYPTIYTKTTILGGFPFTYGSSSVCDPSKSQSELLAPRIKIQNFAQYVELTAYPQRSALEPLLTERKV
jgi:hypothetical protein